MDNFLNIDWNPPLEDMIDKQFFDSERFKKESVTSRMFKGTFVDPFANIHEEQKHLVTSEIMAQLALENENNDSESDEPNEVPVASTEPVKPIEIPKKRAYVPGWASGMRLWFPRKSNLSRQQQALCLRVLLKFYGSRKPEMTATDTEELHTYSSLLPIISQEQQEYLEFAKSRWDASNFTIHDEEFINERWKSKVKRIDDLPRYYTETENVPFVSPKEIGLNFLSCCLKMGTLPVTIMPTLIQRFVLNSPAPKINQRFFSVETNVGSRKNVIFKKPVSEDPNCDRLAKDHEANLVISSGGLNCLAVNMDPQTTSSWILPIVVKRVNDRNVVYVDKPLPPTGLTVMQKNAWIFKYRLKSSANHPYHIRAIRLTPENDATKNPNETKKIDDETMDEKMKTDESSRSNVDNDDEFLRPPEGRNLFYKLFTIGPCGEPQSELLKTRVEKTYKLLVRTRVDGIGKTADGGKQLMMVAPKLEHQMNLGAEAVTVDEAAKQWMSLTFRPDTALARVRIDAITGEVIQFETRTSISVNNEIKRLYKLKTETALTLLYNTADTMASMMPGRYLMRHTVRSGAFATIYREVDGPGKNVFDLQTVYWDKEFPTIPNPPWPAIDNGVVTPVMKAVQRMPAMFIGPHQSRVPVVTKPRGSYKKKTKSKVVRKSPRKKKTSD